MTGHAANSKKRAFRPLIPTLRKALLPLGVLFCMLLFLRNSGLARASVLGGLRLAGLQVLPAVFPFLVFSELLVSGTAPPRLATKGLQTLFRMPAAGCVAILLGWLCGFPIGARCAVRALKNGLLTRDETERAVAISSVPSPAFLIGGVGAGMLGNRAAGLFLYGATIFAAATAGAVSARVGSRESTLPPPVLSPQAAQPFAKRLTSAIRGSATAALHICAFVVFFSAISGAVGAILSRFGMGAVPSAWVGSLLELSGGVAMAAELPDPRAALLLCGAAAGWAGLSVHCQILSVCDGYGLRSGRYFLSKAAQALLCAGAVAVWLLAHGTVG